MTSSAPVSGSLPRVDDYSTMTLSSPVTGRVSRDDEQSTMTSSAPVSGRVSRDDDHSTMTSSSAVTISATRDDEHSTTTSSLLVTGSATRDDEHSTMTSSSLDIQRPTSTSDQTDLGPDAKINLCFRDVCKDPKIDAITQTEDGTIFAFMGNLRIFYGQTVAHIRLTAKYLTNDSAGVVVSYRLTLVTNCRRDYDTN